MSAVLRGARKWTGLSRELRIQSTLGRVFLRASRDYGILIALAALFIALTISSDAFLTRGNLLNVVDQAAIVGIVAVAGTLVIIGGAFDLSVGAIFAIAGIAAAEVALSAGPTAGFFAGAGTGLAAGIVNGLLVTAGHINSFIATLASSIMIRGIGIIATGGFLVNAFTVDGFTVPGRGSAAGVKYSTVFFVAVVAICWLALAKTAFGRYVYAIGGSEETARFSGINVALVRGATFAISGLAAGCAGVIAASRVAQAQVNTGIGLELTAIAAIAIGGTSIFGGRGAVWRTVCGVLLLTFMANGFNLMNVPGHYQQIAEGSIIVVAVALETLSRRNR